MERKVVVITGASSGIGLATAKLMSKNAYKVYGISRSMPKEVFPNFTSLIGDVTNTESLQSCFEHIFNLEKRLDLVICNAGIGVSGASEYVSKEKMQKQIDINFLGAVETSKLAIKYMKKLGGGKIFFTSSVAALIPLPFQAGYSASKASVNLFAQALSLEVNKFNIKISAVMPGDTKTSFTQTRDKVNAEKDYEGRVEKSIRKMEKDEQSGKSPDSVAKVFLSLAKKKNPKPLVVVGFSYKLIAFLSKILPNKLTLYIIKKMYA